MSSPRPSTRFSAPVVEGEILAERYEVVRVIGAGGMGVVVEARHLQLGQRVALKFLLSEECRSEEAVGRFLREGRAAVQITSEHVARVSDVGTLENGAPYIVMEYLEGEDLSEVLAARGTFAVREAVEYVLQACEAIAEAHSLGIIHRDLKPANLFLSRRADGSPLIKVLDFGISKLDDDPQQISLTASTGAMGSPQYMSPEQMRSAKHVDRRTDIWALGAILYELLSGHPPFEADSLIGLCTLVATKDAPPLRTRCEDAPESLDAAISKCLRREPAERYPSLAELAVDLMPFAGQGGRMSAHRIVSILKEAGLAQAVPIPSRSEPKVDLPVPTEGPVAIGQTTEWPTKPTVKSSRRTTMMASVGLAAAAALIAAIWFGQSSRTANDEPRPDDPVAPSSGVALSAQNERDAEVQLVAVFDAEPDVPDAIASAVPSASTPAPTAPAATGGKTARPPSTKTPTPPATKAPPPATSKSGKLPDFGGRHY